MTFQLSYHHDRIRKVLATEQPVLVLGPGCQRIGYDSADSPHWTEVTRRLRMFYLSLGDDDVAPGSPSAPVFLQAFWRSKLSDETLEAAADAAVGEEFPMAGHVPAAYELQGFEGLAASPADRARTALARPLLFALIHSTRCLGEVIGTGETPVISWHQVEHRPEVTVGGSSAARHAAAGALDVLASRAQALYRWGEDENVADDMRFLEAAGIVDGIAMDGLEDEVAAALDAMNVGVIATSAVWLRDGVSTSAALTGAVIEWLGDLLWHILISGAGVPMSQAELAFFVNLKERENLRAKIFTRARPGELRVSWVELEHDKPRPDVAAGLAKRLQSGLYGLEDCELWTQGDTQRLRVIRTLAATLRRMWADRKADRTRPLAVALDSSYDLMLERQLLDLVPKGELFHLVVPVWIGSSHPRMDWLWGTCTKRSGGFDPNDLKVPGTGRNDDSGIVWELFRRDNEDVRQIGGPVIVKLNGSPLLELSDQPIIAGMLAANGVKDVAIASAAIFSEYESLESILGFLPATDQHSGVAQTVAASLDWSARSWMFLGGGFPDWIPRLRLFYSARAGRPPVKKGVLGRPGGTTVTSRLAIDRSFDFPEQALLEALKVDAYRGDLAWLARYPSPRNPAPEVEDFLADVKKWSAVSASQDRR